ncbi:universal stress protein [Stieleria varia]|uniref:Universal stress protein F n=1 Tax=Stieleria varia TaxID=2528005 RepID=A0A5C5ZVS5_9BACT|nr:universal stress protein [Stieleria varia]TWT91266.1 Universal stress protein F [Stieleria varia]
MSGLRPQKTLVPIDFSDLAYDALERALEITDPDGYVDVVHVLPILSAMELGYLYGNLTDDSRIAHVTKILKERFAAVKYDRVELHIAIGDPGSHIAELAKQLKTDLIVIPSHGYGFLKHLLLGSTAERVIRLATCPVLVLRESSESPE